MRMPTEASLRKLTKQVCLDFDRPEPILTFEGDGRDGGGRTNATGIIMPSREWVLLTSAASPMSYRLLMLHELAHWIIGLHEGHTPAFYEFLFDLCHRYGVPVDFALFDEAAYKPRSARLGFRQWYNTLYALSGAPGPSQRVTEVDNVGQVEGQSAA